MTDEIIKAAQEAFEAAAEAEADNRREAQDDIRFAFLDGHQWPEAIRRDREANGLPCHEVNRLQTPIKQVVNDGRLNKPSIVVHPVDSGSDPETAQIFNGLIRHIEQSSNAEVAYDTALEFAVTAGLGYLRVNTRYSGKKSFDQDLVIERVADPFSIYGDPESTACDSSDWNVAFVTDSLTKAAFETKYGGADPIDWKTGGWRECKSPWLDGDRVMVAEYWTREEATETILMLSDGQVVEADIYSAQKEMFDALGLTVVGERDVPSHKVTQRILSGADVLETRAWGGSYIPIIPCFGEERWIDGRRHYKGIVRSAKDSQRMLNYWRSKSTEAVAMAPLTPFIGPVGAFVTDAAKWATANRSSHAYIEYDGDTPPQRQPYAGVPAGALQEALNATDDIKSITGIYDASLGARSNETSGKAIQARQREGDVSTFNYIDNLSRAIRHTGRILLDLIPKVYGQPRILRILGPDGKPGMVPINQPTTVPVLDADGQKAGMIEKIYDIGAGEYDLVVKSGPSFSTQREEAATQMIEMMRANPSIAPIMGDLIAQNMDWPGADEIARRLKSMLPPQAQGQNPEIEQAKAALQKMAAQLQQMQAENAALQADKALEAEKLRIEQFKAETDRIEAEARIRQDQLQTSAQIAGLTSFDPGR